MYILDSEQNSKEKRVFLFILERKYLRGTASKVRISEQNSKEKCVFLFILERNYLSGMVSKVGISVA